MRLCIPDTETHAVSVDRGGSKDSPVKHSTFRNERGKKDPEKDRKNNQERK